MNFLGMFHYRLSHLVRLMTVGTSKCMLESAVVGKSVKLTGSELGILIGYQFSRESIKKHKKFEY